MFLAVGLGLAALLPPRPAVALKKAVTVEKVEYQGWKNNLRLSNGDVEVIATLDVGPRIISYRLADGKNVFKEYAEQLGKAGEKEWMIRGGHRLWVGPEDPTRTYAPDNGPVKYQDVSLAVELPTPKGPDFQPAGFVQLSPAPEREYGIQKELIVGLAERGSRVVVVHRIRNVGDKPAELAPWALSVMAPGGVEIIPLPPKKPHPDSPKTAKSPADFAASQSMALWPYFDFKDPRWTFGTKYVTLRQDPKRGPTKLGLSLRTGWVGYLNDGTLFVKRWTKYQEGKPYPDNGCNFETFSNEDMLEVESLGPLVKLAPGTMIEHTEHWELHKNVAAFKDEAGIDKNISRRVMEK